MVASWAGFSGMPGEENPFARKALLPRHSGTNQTPAISRFAFQGRHSKPLSGFLEQVASAIAALIAHEGGRRLPDKSALRLALGNPIPVFSILTTQFRLDGIAGALRLGRSSQPVRLPVLRA
jgi:hypothetical protein